MEFDGSVEKPHNFEARKRDHIKWSLASENEALGKSGFAQIELIHEALPDLNFSEVDLTVNVLGRNNPTPFYVSSMTAGHSAGEELNYILAEQCVQQGWLMGVGSQRRELSDANSALEWQRLRQKVGGVRLLSNLGIAQVISTPVAQLQRLVDALEAECLIVHLNALQECLQVEGTPNFKGGLTAIANLVKSLSVPVIVKETGCGFSAATLQRLNETGVYAVDVSGYGGTHWGRIEGSRAPASHVKHEAASAFNDWGIATAKSLLAAQEFKSAYQIWASGGVRSGVEAAKALALGAQMVGFAKPALQAALEGGEVLAQWMKKIEFELKVAMFCTGIGQVKQFKQRKVWQWQTM